MAPPLAVAPFCLVYGCFSRFGPFLVDMSENGGCRLLEAPPCKCVICRAYVARVSAAGFCLPSSVIVARKTRNFLRVYARARMRARTRASIASIVCLRDARRVASDGGGCSVDARWISARAACGCIFCVIVALVELSAKLSMNQLARLHARSAIRTTIEQQGRRRRRR